MYKSRTKGPLKSNLIQIFLAVPRSSSGFWLVAHLNASNCLLFCCRAGIVWEPKDEKESCNFFVAPFPPPRNRLSLAWLLLFLLYFCHRQKRKRSCDPTRMNCNEILRLALAAMATNWICEEKGLKLLKGVAGRGGQGGLPLVLAAYQPARQSSVRTGTFVAAWRQAKTEVWC